MSNFQDIVDFLIAHPPFNHIPQDTLEQISSRIAIVYIKAGQEIEIDANEPCLRVIRSGSLEVRSSDGVLLDRISAGACFGYGPLLTGEKSSRQFFVLEDGLVYLISRDDFSHLRHNIEEFDYFFARETRKRSEKLGKNVSRDVEFSLTLSNIMQGQLNTTEKETQICEAAKKMRDARVSSILVCENDRLLGIVTDRDLRTRVVAECLDLTAPLGNIMTQNPISLSPKDSVHQAYITMMSHSIHHLPITENGKPVGMITLSDLIRARNSEPLFIIKAIHRATSVTELKELSYRFPELIEKLVLADVGAEEIGKVVSTLTDSLTSRLLILGHEALGNAPCEFCWMAFGSQGRKEQTLNSDQDNAFLLDNSATDQDIEYFLKLGAFVCDGLNECGVVHCPGNIMAKNPQWCLRLSEWQQHFFHWIDVPDPVAMLNTSIFYDMRQINGDSRLFEALQEAIFKRVRGKTIFLAYLLDNALKNSPPLGFFKTFVLERDGNHNSVLDLKHRGTAPIVDIARLYCLSEGVRASNTLERLAALKKNKIIHRETADNLIDAYEFISDLRLENQQKLLAKGLPASNNLDPKSLSPLIRQQLKDAFSAVQDCQHSAKSRFGHGVI